MAASFRAARAIHLDGAPAGDLRQQSLEEIFNSDEMVRLRRLHGQAALPRSTCARAVPRDPSSPAGGAELILHGKWVAAQLPVVERLVYGRKLPKTLLRR
jgi:hypothetical protein